MRRQGSNAASMAGPGGPGRRPRNQARGSVGDSVVWDFEAVRSPAVYFKYVPVTFFFQSLYDTKG